LAAAAERARTARQVSGPTNGTPARTERTGPRGGTACAAGLQLWRAMQQARSADRCAAGKRATGSSLTSCLPTEELSSSANVCAAARSQFGEEVADTLNARLTARWRVSTWEMLEFLVEEELCKSVNAPDESVVDARACPRRVCRGRGRDWPIPAACAHAQGSWTRLRAGLLR
jgi:hypothetical protein